MSSLYVQYKNNISGEYVHTAVSGLSKAVHLCSVLDESKVTEISVYRLYDGKVITVYRHFTEVEQLAMGTRKEAVMVGANLPKSDRVVHVVH